MSKRFVYYNAGVSAQSLLLDDYPAELAYSLRKLRTSYTGSAIRVRRDSDNAEQDIGFSSNDLDTASLLSFVGSGNGFVTTWYDQQNNNNAQTLVLNEQLKIVSNGNLELSGTNPTLFWDTGIEKLILPDLSYLTEGECFILVEAESDPPTDLLMSWKFGTQTGGPFRNHYPWLDSNIYEDFGSNSRKNTGNPSTALDKQNVYNVLSANNNFKSFINYENYYNTVSNIVSFNSEPFLGPFNGLQYPSTGNKISELILYSQDTGINRNLIKQNQIDYYDI